MQKIPRQGAPHLETSVRQPGTHYADGIGQTLDELKIERGQVLPAEIAPLPTKSLSDLIGATRATDQLRLNMPEAANPFQTSPLGPKQDFFLLQTLLRRSKGGVSKDIVSQLDRLQGSVPEQSLNFMLASLDREENMLQLLEGLMKSIGQIQNRIVGSQEG